MSVIERAKELGQAIAESPEYQAFVSEEESFLKTQDAVDLMKEYEKETLKLQNLQALGLPVPPSAVTDLQSIQEKIREHPAIQKLVEAQKGYEDLLRRVNEEINGSIEGRSRSNLIIPGSQGFSIEGA
jgi:cell fate (sporulation/competence/biofilm development) regulator YlbF (YheA/YmcA/DUF963 family)